MSLVQSAHMRMKRKKERSSATVTSPASDATSPRQAFDAYHFPATADEPHDGFSPAASPRSPAGGVQGRRAYSGINSLPADDYEEGYGGDQRHRRPQYHGAPPPSGGSDGYPQQQSRQHHMLPPPDPGQRGGHSTSMPPRPRGTSDPGDGEAFDPFAPSPVNLPQNTVRGHTPTFADAFPAVPAPASPPLATIEGSAHRFVYPDDSLEAELRLESDPNRGPGLALPPAGGASVVSGQSSTAAVAQAPGHEYEYHTEPDESASSRRASSRGEDGTVDSEEAQYGTPVKKKAGGRMEPIGAPGRDAPSLLTEITTKKKRRRHPRGPASPGSPTTPMSTLDGRSPGEDAGGNIPPSPQQAHSPQRQAFTAAQFSPGGIAAHAKRFTNRVDPSPQQRPVFADESNPRPPSRGIGSSRSYDDSVMDTSSNWWKLSADSDPSRNDGLFSSRKASRSWDEEGGGPVWDPSAVRKWGTWGSDDKGSAGFGNEESTKDSTPSSDLFQDDPAANREALAEWDRAEVAWGSPGGTTNAFPSSKGRTSPGRAHPWKNSSGGGNAGGEVTPNSNDASEDDSLFEFDTNRSSPMSKIQLPALVDQRSGKAGGGRGGKTPSPEAIFDKINSGLKEADKTRKSISSPRNLVDDESEEPRAGASPTSRVAFAGEKENTVHTYVVPSDSGDALEARDDDDDDGDDIGIDVVNKSPPKRAALSEKISSEARKGASNASGGGFNNDGNSADGSADDTYGDSTLDTGGSTYRSEADGKGADGGGPTLLDHVGGAVGGAVGALALAMGGLLAGASTPTAGGGNSNGDTDMAGGGTVDRVEESRARMRRPRSPRSEDDDDSDGSEGDDTYGTMAAQSTALSTFTGGNEDGSASEGGDWLGYMEKLLFPDKEKDVSHILDVGSFLLLSRWVSRLTFELSPSSSQIAVANALRREQHVVRGGVDDEEHERPGRGGRVPPPPGPGGGAGGTPRPGSGVQRVAQHQRPDRRQVRSGHGQAAART